MIDLQGKSKLMSFVAGLRQFVQAVPFRISSVADDIDQPFVASWGISLALGQVLSRQTWAMPSWFMSTLMVCPLMLPRSNEQLFTPASACISWLASIARSAATGVYGLVGPAIVEYMTTE